MSTEQERRVELESQYPDVCNTEELKSQYTVQGFLAPMIVCIRKSDNVQGSMRFDHEPRFYYSFVPHMKATH